LQEGARLPTKEAAMKFLKISRTDKRNLAFLLMLGLFLFYEYGVGHFDALTKMINPDPGFQCQKIANRYSTVIGLINANMELIRELRTRGVEEINGKIIISGPGGKRKEPYSYSLADLNRELYLYQASLKNDLIDSPGPVMQSDMSKIYSALIAEKRYLK
jgi:hypothetical protein